MRLLWAILGILVVVNTWVQLFEPYPDKLREWLLIYSVVLFASDCLVYLYVKKGGK